MTKMLCYMPTPTAVIGYCVAIGHDRPQTIKHIKFALRKVEDPDRVAVLRVALRMAKAEERILRCDTY